MDAAAVKDPVDLRSHSGIGGFVSLWTSQLRSNLRF